MKYGKSNEKLIKNLIVAASSNPEDIERISQNRLKVKVTAIIDIETRNIIFEKI